MIEKDETGQFPDRQLLGHCTEESCAPPEENPGRCHLTSQRPRYLDAERQVCGQDRPQGSLNTLTLGFASGHWTVRKIILHGHSWTRVG